MPSSVTTTPRIVTGQGQRSLVRGKPVLHVGHPAFGAVTEHDREHDRHGDEHGRDDDVGNREQEPLGRPEVAETRWWPAARTVSPRRLGPSRSAAPTTNTAGRFRWAGVGAPHATASSGSGVAFGL